MQQKDLPKEFPLMVLTIKKFFSRIQLYEGGDKMKKSIKITIIVLSLLIVGLVTYIVIDKIANRDSSNTSTNNTKNSSASASTNVTANEVTNEVKNNSNNTTTENKNDGAKTSGNSSVSASDKIAEALKERRFMAKNNIDIDSKAKFMKVGNNIYIIEIKHTDSQSDIEYTSIFSVAFNGENAEFEKIEPEKHGYTLFVDAENHVVQAKRTMKQVTNTIYYDLSKGKLTVMENTDASKYKFVSFDDNALELNDENINKIVK